MMSRTWFENPDHVVYALGEIEKAHGLYPTQGQTVCFFACLKTVKIPAPNA